MSFPPGHHAKKKREKKEKKSPKINSKAAFPLGTPPALEGVTAADPLPMGEALELGKAPCSKQEHC